MESLKDINKRSETGVYLQQSGAELSLATTSGTRLSDDSVRLLGQWMAEMQARYPAQTLPQGTPAMYLAEWEDMAGRYGMDDVRAGLMNVVRDRSRGPYFPSPDEIEAHIRVLRTDRRIREEAKRRTEEEAEWKATWERERAEEEALAAQGIPPVRSEGEQRLDALLATAKAGER